MTIIIKNLSFEAILGILKQERDKPQRIIVNAKIKYKYTNKQFINYVEISDLIKSTIIQSKFELLEDALKTLLIQIKDKFPNIDKIKLKISKPDILQDCEVSVKIKKNFKKN